MQIDKSWGQGRESKYVWIILSEGGGGGGTKNYDNNSSWLLLKAYLTPKIVLRALHVLTHLIIIIRGTQMGMCTEYALIL